MAGTACERAGGYYRSANRCLNHAAALARAQPERWLEGIRENITLSIIGRRIRAILDGDLRRCQRALIPDFDSYK